MYSYRGEAAGVLRRHGAKRGDELEEEESEEVEEEAQEEEELCIESNASLI